MSEKTKNDESFKNKQRPNYPWKLGCGEFLAVLIVVLFCGGVTALGLAPPFVYTFPERFLPPQCDEVLFAQIMESPPARMRVVKTIYFQTRVIAVDARGTDICFFKGSTSTSLGIGFWFDSSANGQYLAFSSNQFVSEYDVVFHFFIVNTYDGSYSHFIPENPNEYIEKESWSPDSTVLATVSHSGHCCVPEPNTYITLMTPFAEIIWRVDLGTSSFRSWGNLTWSEDGTQIIYGRDSEDRWAYPQRSFWCMVDATGTDWNCDR